MAPAPADELSIAERIDQQCDRFETEFASGQRPRLEEFLADAAEPFRLPLFRGLLELELELRRRAGELPQRDDYARRFEPYASIVDLVFAELNAGPSRRFSARSAARDSSVKGTAADTSQGPSRPAPAEPSPPLTQVARFLIEKRLGEGAFGAVYKARDPQLDRDVALKVPHAGALSSKDDRERFLREARAAAGLHHANICLVHEVGTTADGRDYIVMAFIDGKPLSKVLQSGTKLTERQIASVVRKLAQALDEAHQKGVIHRDLKPANIMVNRKGEPVIMDFGLARRASPSDPQLSHSGQIMGTPAYMSPEQARGDSKTIGPATDVYSLGIVLYEMLCGQRPFSGTVTEVIGSILHVEAPPPSQFRDGLDPKLQAICMKAIAKKPADRYASMKDFAAALTDYLKAAVSALATPVSAASTSNESLVTNEFARLIEAISAEIGPKQKPAPRQAVRSSTKTKGTNRRDLPWWAYPVGAGVLGMVILLGIIFFVQTRTITQTVTIHEDITDPTLTFILDGKPLDAEKLGAPMPLTTAEHLLDVHKDGRFFKRYKVTAIKGQDHAAIDVAMVAEPTTTSRPTSPIATPPSSVPPPAIAPFTAERAFQHQEDWAKHLGVPVDYTNSIGMKFRLIPPGEFFMGSVPAAAERGLAIGGEDKQWPSYFRSEAPRHRVILTQPMYLSVHEVRQKDYQAVVGKNPSMFAPTGHHKGAVAGRDTTSHPVETTNWYAAADFCTKLSEKEQLTPFYDRSGQTVTILEGTGYRMPTEAEWEFACRAGSSTEFWNGDKNTDLESVAWIGVNSGRRTHAAGELKANPFGICDMHGNVWEWVQDWWDVGYYGRFQERPVSDPTGPFSGAQRVIRGGDWNNEAYFSRSSLRFARVPWTDNFPVGFRTTLTVGAVQQTLKLASGPKVVAEQNPNRTDGPELRN